MLNWKKKDILQFDVFFLTFDEPYGDERWLKIESLLPHARRVNGIKGFNLAHKKCGQLATTDRVVIIDGDNSFVDDNCRLLVSKKLLKTEYILSYSSQNSVNGLVYGNGGIKCWPKETLLNLESHEESKSKESATDFCFSYPYYQMPETPTISNIHLTPFQSFRSGFREGVKMCLERGLLLTLDKNSLAKETINPDNYFRLKTWCEIGRDVENGIWAIYGARLGVLKILTEESTIDKIIDYDWFKTFWNMELSKIENLEFELSLLKKRLEEDFRIELQELDANDSLRFKKTLKNPHREGLMYFD